MRAPRRVAARFSDCLRKLVPNATLGDEFSGPKLGSTRAMQLKVGNQYMYLQKSLNLGTNICIFSYLYECIGPNF